MEKTNSLNESKVLEIITKQKLENKYLILNIPLLYQSFYNCTVKSFRAIAIKFRATVNIGLSVSILKAFQFFAESSFTKNKVICLNKVIKLFSKCFFLFTTSSY
jgi:hypothetical protein